LRRNLSAEGDDFIGFVLQSEVAGGALMGDGYGFCAVN
jgi:hypothetical protein